MGKNKEAIEMARTSRAGRVHPSGWTHKGNLQYLGPDGAYFDGMLAKLHRPGFRDVYAYDVHEAAAICAVGLKKAIVH